MLQQTSPISDLQVRLRWDVPDFFPQTAPLQLRSSHSQRRPMHKRFCPSRCLGALARKPPTAHARFDGFGQSQPQKSRFPFEAINSMNELINLWYALLVTISDIWLLWLESCDWPGDQTDLLIYSTHADLCQNRLPYEMLWHGSSSTPTTNLSPQPSPPWPPLAIDKVFIVSNKLPPKIRRLLRSFLIREPTGFNHYFPFFISSSEMVPSPLLSSFLMIDSICFIVRFFRASFNSPWWRVSI